MNNWMTKRRTRILWIGLAATALATVAVFGAMQALTTADAEQIALAQYPGATVLGTELDDENGASVYSVELQADSGELEVKIDPNSGAILAADADDDHEDVDPADVDDADDDQVENEQHGDFENED